MSEQEKYVKALEEVVRQAKKLIMHQLQGNPHPIDRQRLELAIEESDEAKIQREFPYRTKR